MKKRPALAGALATALAVGLAPALHAQPATAVVTVSGKASDPPAPDPASATLKNTYWKLIALGGQTVIMLPRQQREVRITLSSHDARVTGFSGCNTLVGTYVQDGQALRFTQMATTGMACEPPMAALENQVLEMLASTTGQHIDGQQLSLLNGAQVLARFEAVYL